jgi:hypothetical protein
MRRFLLLAAVAALPLRAQHTPRSSEADAYTRYELLAPGSAKFRIIYEVTATSAGAKYYFNPIRKGSVASDESVIDRATGKPLRFEEVGAATARAEGIRVADSTQRYIRVTLTRPVPPNDGEQRLLILKTYEDALSYFMKGDTIVFSRGLGIKRNAVVLPLGYELVNSTFPAQVLQEADGRVGITFWNATPTEAAVTLKAVKTSRLVGGGSTMAARLQERSHQDREITYFLQQPETHAFDLYHDYTETRAGVSTYINIVRPGSTVSKPSARNLDTGDTLSWQILKGDAITKAKLDVPDVGPETEVVVFRFPPVAAGGSVRIRMFETYSDAARYRLDGDELVWDRSFGRPINSVVLPSGWMLTNSAVPAVVTVRADGRVQLEFVNPRLDDIAVLITAKRR